MHAFVLLQYIRCCAAMYGHTEMVRILINVGACPNKIEGAPFTTAPLYTAYRDDKLETFRVLLELGADPNLEVAGNSTLLCKAIEDDRLEFVDVLIASSADLNLATGDDGVTPISTAVLHCNVEMVATLIRSGADVNKVGPTVMEGRASSFCRGGGRMVNKFSLTVWMML